MVRRGWRFWAALIVAGLALVLAAAAWVWRDDIMRTALDPRVPYQTYDPPPAPDYARRSAWALLPGAPGAASGPLDVFFVHPTTYDGGEEWNASVGDAEADRVLFRDMLPNYAGPYQRLGRVFAPRYRQASLYTQLTLRDDARQARRFAYEDVRTAFRTYLARYNRGRPFMVVGVEQGGALAARLLAEEIAPHPSVRNRFVAAHLIQTVTPEPPGLMACTRPDQVDCLLAFASVEDGEAGAARRMLDRALVWRGDQLGGLGGQHAVCVNPLFGGAQHMPAVDGPEDRRADALAELNRGAVNATGLPWGARPAFLRRQVGAVCREGVLHVSRPESEQLQATGGWAARRRVPAFSLFYADLEADAACRLKAWRAGARPDGYPDEPPFQLCPGPGAPPVP